MTHRIEPSVGNVILIIFVLSLLDALSGRFVSLACACEHSFVFFSSCGLCGESLTARARREFSLVGPQAP